jgi:leucine dehydrogenase
VGLPLAEMLAGAGATLLLSDIDGEVADDAARRFGGTVVAPDAVYDASVDVYAPCAIGATINPETVPRLSCSIVAGSANNQLLTPADGTALHELGILYAPDYIINAGGAVAFAGIYDGITDEGELNSRVETIEDSLGRIFAEAEARNESPLLAARDVADQFLATTRGEASAPHSRR